MQKKIKIIHTGLSGIPFQKNAAVNRCLAIYGVLADDNFEVLAINNKSLNQKNDKAAKKGFFDMINYLFTTAYLIKPNSFIKRRYNNFTGKWNEIWLLIRLGFKNELDLMFFYPSGNYFNFVELLTYRFLSKIFRFKIISHFVEYRSGFYNRTGILYKINDRLFDKYFMHLVDGVIPISEFLIDRIKEKRPKMPLLKLPPLVNFDLFTKYRSTQEKNYFLYVGNTGHYRPIVTILDAFSMVTSTTYQLKLVLHGTMDRILKVIDEHPKKDQIQVLSNLEYKELIQCYCNAKALLIPLDDSLKDVARFPNKIAEYLASANPIITANNGEIPYYFTDMENAFVAKTDEAALIAEKINFIVENPDRASEIGLEGYQTGLQYFDSNNIANKLEVFINKVLD